MNTLGIHTPDQKHLDKQVEDLNKAIWYIQDEIKRITEFKNKQK